MFPRGECVGCGTKFDEKNSWPLVSRFPGHEKRTVKREKGGKKRKGGEREREEGNKTSKKQREKRFEALLETSRETGRGKEREKRARSCESGTGATTKSQRWVTCIQEVNSFVAVS